MEYIIDHDMHIHSQISPCSNDPCQTKERILAYGVESGWKLICLMNKLDFCIVSLGHLWLHGFTVPVEMAPLDPQTKRVKA